MKKTLIINILVFVGIILFLIFSFFSIKKVTSNGIKAEVVNNKSVNEQIYVSDLIKLYKTDKNKFDKLYLNSKITITDDITNIQLDYIDKESSYATSYDVINLENNLRLFVGHNNFEIVGELNVGDKITVDSKIISCDTTCILRDIKYLDDAGFKYEDNTIIKLVKRAK